MAHYRVRLIKRSNLTSLMYKPNYYMLCLHRFKLFHNLFEEKKVNCSPLKGYRLVSNICGIRVKSLQHVGTVY